MRVITGTARGRNLEVPTGTSTRPTSARVKEAVLSSVQFELEGASVLDLFAGSGQMGIEALSRGANSCVFVEHAKEAQAVLRRNLAHTGMEKSSIVMPMDAVSYLRSAAGAFDIAFLDPPYQEGFLPLLLNLLVPLMRESGVILCESGKRETLPDASGTFSLYREYIYGHTKITAYRHNASSDMDRAAEKE